MAYLCQLLYLCPIFNNQMLSQLIAKSITNFGQSIRNKSAQQRIKHYSRFPNQFQLVTRIRPPDLTDPNIKFPINIPIRYRHIYKLKKVQYLENTQKIHWDRLQPNEILLGFENIQYLTFPELVQGLKHLSQTKGQQLHDWNKHEWVSKALDKVTQNFVKIKLADLMNFYFLMKKLRYENKDFWKIMYSKLQQNIYELYAKHFQYIYITYYDTWSQYFSPDAKKKFDKLMEGRLRQFSPSGILGVFEYFLRDKKIDNYWLENVFISLFKAPQYVYTPSQIGKIFRSMMILGHQKNDRLYDNLYGRLKKAEYGSIEEVEQIQQIIQEVKQLFESHRVDDTLQLLELKKQQLKNKLNQQKKKTIEEMVKDDLKYFLEKRKLKKESKQQDILKN